MHRHLRRNAKVKQKPPSARSDLSTAKETICFPSLYLAACRCTVTFVFPDEDFGLALCYLVQTTQCVSNVQHLHFVFCSVVARCLVFVFRQGTLDHLYGQSRPKRRSQTVLAEENKIRRFGSCRITKRILITESFVTVRQVKPARLGKLSSKTRRLFEACSYGTYVP